MRAWVLRARGSAVILAGAAASAMVAGVPDRGHAETLGCSIGDAPSGPARQVLHCASGPTIEAEAKADVKIIDPGSSGAPHEARIDAGAALLEVPAGYPGGFQIVTPRAVASVRGTTWVVDVTADATAVFVVAGHVEVKSGETGAGVTLAAGEGVEVGSADLPLKVETWAPARREALLARFGR